MLCHWNNKRQYIVSSFRDVIIISTNEKVLKCFEKTFLYQGKNEIPRMFFEEFKYFTDPGTLILLVYCAGRKVYYLLFSCFAENNHNRYAFR